MKNIKDWIAAFASCRSFCKKSYLCLAFLLVIYIGWQALQLVLVLVPEGDRKIVAMPTYYGDKWYISFTHSVEKTTWEEFFTVNGASSMTMTHTKFASLGCGHPYSATDGQFSRTEDNKFQMIMNRPYQEVPIRVSEQSRQHIRHGDDKYDLVDLYGDGTAVTVKIMKRYQYWLDY